MASISPNSFVNCASYRSTSSDLNGNKTIDILGNIHLDESPNKSNHRNEENPITLCEVLRQQNDALRQELHDIRREMDEITDQFRTEDAEEFKQLQAELEIAAKNCRILQFKLRKSEKRNENIEAEKAALEDKIHELTRENYRVRDLDEELLIAKEVSVRLHAELEKSEQTRNETEQFNVFLKENLDRLKECLDENQSNDNQTWQLAVHLYESLFREYFLLEEFNDRKVKQNNGKHLSNVTNEHDISDLIQSYQQKISILNDEILRLKEDTSNRDNELTQLRIQNTILKQRSRSVERTTNIDQSSNDDESNRSRRGVSVDGGGNLREQLDASLEQIRALKTKLLRVEDELNNSVLEKQTLTVQLDQQSQQNIDKTIHDDIHRFIKQIEYLIDLIKQNKSDEKMINDLQQTMRSSRWTKSAMTDETATNEIIDKANQLLTLILNKTGTLNKIRYHLTNLTTDTNDTCLLLEELDTIKHELQSKNDIQQQLQLTIDKCNQTVQIQQERIQSLEQTIEQQRTIRDDNVRLTQINQKQAQDLRHMDQLRQSIITFEKKLDQKQTRVNELSLKIIEKEDIIETKVKECQKHRLELRELETKYYTLGKQLEEQITLMSKEIEKLNVEKEMLKFDLESLRLNGQTKPTSFDDEIMRVKNECRQQIVDGEIDAYKLRFNQMNKEKDELTKLIQDFEKKYRDLQMKADADEQSFMRMKKDMSDKQRKYDESIKMKSELQNAVDRLRQKLYDLELHNQDKQNKYNIDKQQWDNHRVELSGKINELEEQLAKVNKRQRKDLETTWKKERNDLQKQLQQCQQLIKDLQNQLVNRDTPIHIQEKLNVLITENELLMNKINDLELVCDDILLLKTEVQRLRDKNSSDWNYWRKQQSDLYTQLRQQNQVKEFILNKFDRLQKQIKTGVNDADISNRLVRDISIGPISLNSFQNDTTTKSSLSNFSRETTADEIELPHGTLDGRTVNTNDIVGAMHDEDKQRMFNKTYSAQENTAASIEEIASKIDRVEDHLFSYRRFMDFIRAKSEKSASIVRDDSLTNIVQNAEFHHANKRLASAPPENTAQATSQRRSRFDGNANNNHEHLSTSTTEQQLSDLMTSSMIGTLTTNDVGSSKNRFFSLSRRFRFRVQSPEKSSSIQSASVHFNDEDIDLETKERTTRKSDKDGNRPSKGILKTLRHRSPFRFRSKDAVIPEQEPPPPPPSPPPPQPPKETARLKVPTVPPPGSQTKQRGRLVELKKTAPKTSSTSTTSTTTPAPAQESTGSTLVRRTSGLKDLIHKFEITPNDRPTKPKRNANESSQDEPKKPATDSPPADSKSKPVDIPDLLRNVDNEPASSQSLRPTLKHSNSNRQTASFDSHVSMVSASESIATNSSFRRPTSTARPLMISLSKDES